MCVFLFCCLHWIDSKQKLHDNYRSRSTEASNQTIHPRNSAASTHLILQPVLVLTVLLLLPSPSLSSSLVLHIYLLNYISATWFGCIFAQNVHSLKSYNVHHHSVEMFMFVFAENVCFVYANTALIYDDDHICVLNIHMYIERLYVRKTRKIWAMPSFIYAPSSFIGVHVVNQCQIFKRLIR